MSLDLTKLENVKIANGKTTARCPACKENGSDEGGDHLVIYPDDKFGCVKHEGNSEHRKRIFALVGVKSESTPRAEQNWPTLDQAAKDCTPKGHRLVKAWLYAKNGRPVGGVARYEPPIGDKTFRQFHPVAGGWQKGGPKEKWPLLGYDKLPATGPVVFVEGEKTFEAAISIGIPAVCSAGGASAAQKSDWSPLAGHEVWGLLDNNESGERYGRGAKAELHKLDPATAVRFVRLPGVPDGGDLVDWLATRRGTKTDAELRDEIEAMAQAAPIDPVDLAAEKADGNVEAPEAVGKPDPLTGRKSLAELAKQPIDKSQTLLGNRFLCRRGAMLYVGRSGLGKSSSSGQQDICWALGREAFGIAPSKPLNILCVQAENDEGDLHEMAAGVLLGLGLTDEEVNEVNRRTTYVQWFETGEAFLTKLRDALTAERDAGRPFDLVRIDPLMAFAGGDLIKPEVIASFCRGGLNSIAFDFDCGIIAVHHTPKINQTARPRMDGPEWIYAATGCADLSNWARAILVIADSPNSMPGTFRLIGAKRGKRITWHDTKGAMEFERYFSHAENTGGMYWRTSTPEEVVAATSSLAGTKKPDALQAIACKDESVMRAHAMNIIRDKPLVAADFHAAVIREFDINSKYARTVVKILTEGEGKPVKVVKIGKVHWHGTAEQLTALRNPPLKGVI